MQFLAMESPAAVPRNISKLARKHKGVTLLFMDIVGFTEFSKVSCILWHHTGYKNLGNSKHQRDGPLLNLRPTVDYHICCLFENASISLVIVRLLNTNRSLLLSPRLLLQQKNCLASRRMSSLSKL